MSDFDRWSVFRESEEGGWSDVPEDAGGLTRFGISSAAHPEVDLATLTREHASEIAKRDYWDLVRGDEMPWPLSLVLADAAFNFSPKRVVGWLQAEVGAAIDGKLGADTMERAIKIVAQIGADVLAQHVHMRRVDAHIDRVRREPGQVIFLKGWMRRTHRLSFLMGE